MSQHSPVNKGKPLTKKRGRPRETNPYKEIVGALGDVESPSMKTVINSLIEPIKKVIRDEMCIQERKFDILTEKIVSLEKEVREKNSYIDQLESRIDELEQYSRRNCLVFSGITETENETTDKAIIELAKNVMKVDLDPRDINRSHRVPGGPKRPNTETPRNIIVKFTNYNARKKIYENKKMLKVTKIEFS